MRSAFANILLVLVTLGVSDCTSVSSQRLPDANAAAVLDGRWNLDLQASQDVRARLLPLLERNEQHWRQREEKYDQPPPRSDGASGVDEGVSHFLWLQHERQKEVDALIALLSPATQVDFQHKDGSIRIATNKSEGTRVVTPGERSSLFLSVGSFEVTSAWSHGSLKIESRGTEGNRLDVTEVFTPRADSLEKQMEVKIPGISKQSFRMVYRR
jgi:hypothetical protein